MNGPLVTKGSKYTDDVRRQAIGIFVVTGSYKATARQLGIPHKTVHEWRKKEWWINEIALVRVEKADELDAQITNSIHKAFKSVDDRLDQGDAYIKKDGEIGYKPVSCRDSATVGGIMYDKRQIMRLLPTTISTTTDSHKLLKLQEQFELLANTKMKEVDASVVAEG